MLERLEFMHTTLYIQEKKTTVSGSIGGSMVREVEEVLGSNTNWSKHFYKQFHHEMAGLRVHKKSILGSHIRMIFAWYKQERCKDHVDPLPSTIPPPSVSVRIRPTIVKPREPAQVQAPVAVANGHSGGETAPILE
ncbi:unnamed protein product [Calypogeia fissa]